MPHDHIVGVNKMVAMDFDDTFSAAPAYHLACIALAKQHNITTLIVSCRVCECTPDGKCENHVELAEATGCSVILTSGAAKQWYLERRGIRVDWWVEDDCRSVIYGR